ncbi:hypothetical protein EW146_g10050 [Bondarzewia mesenterica]|uniref:DUF396-domain-containing protein n=1 Tax=Bondarzewia mesenterica TaxID=1095465 RepID=A0A4S4L0S9_9AGAM|nr:hypothetical protein EW146_g10050 [Bondarzewia mesenterica]
MSFLHLLSYVAAVVAFMFVTLSLASGLLWLSEVIEEHSTHAKSIGMKGIYCIIILHLVLYWTDALPLSKVLFSIFCHVVYLQNFSRTWPLIELTSPSFIASCILVITDHFVWFFHFARVTHDARQRSSRPFHGYKPATLNAPGFGDMATFFGICVWLAPLFLFLSLSANDNALPTASGQPDGLNSPTRSVSQTRTPLLRSLLDTLPLDYLPRLHSRPRRSVSEGLIAPHSPIRRATSPLPMPSSPTYSLNNLPSPRIPRTPTRSTSHDVQDTVAHTQLTPDFRLSSPPVRKQTLSSTLPSSPSLSRRR